jgi:heme/copper-type cytochrome/quinol oxidase subunit 2
VAYGAALCWASVCLVASFRPNNLANPYWSEAKWLRTDTCGVICFLIVALTLVVSEFLRLRRKQGQKEARQHVQAGSAFEPFATAVAEVIVLLSSGLVVYVSVNAVTHPDTLVLRVTHFATWPTEGTTRIAALFLSVCSVAFLRYQTIDASRSTGRKGA